MVHWSALLPLILVFLTAQGKAEVQELVRRRTPMHPAMQALAVTIQTVSAKPAKEKEEYRLLAEQLPAALEVLRDPNELWEAHDVPNGVVSFPDIPWYSYGVARFALMRAGRLAPNREVQEKWWRQELALVVRLRQHPTTAEYLRRPPDFYHEELVSAITAQCLDSVRHRLAEGGFLRPDEWGVDTGYTWSERRGGVLYEQGTVFVEMQFLRTLGVPVRLEGPTFVVDGRRGRVRFSVAPTGAGSARRGFRRAERVYLPVEELSRLKYCQALVYPKSQMVILIPYREDLPPDFGKAPNQRQPAPRNGAPGFR